MYIKLEQTKVAHSSWQCIGPILAFTSIQELHATDETLHNNFIQQNRDINISYAG